MARQGAGVLLVARVGDAGGSVVEKLLDVVGSWVLEAGSSGARTVHQSMASADTLWESAVVVSWFQGLAAFVLGKKRIYKVGTHSLLSHERSQKNNNIQVFLFSRRSVLKDLALSLDSGKSWLVAADAFFFFMRSLKDVSWCLSGSELLMPNALDFSYIRR